MRLARFGTLLFGGFGFAARWAIDGSCDFVRIADPGNGLDPFLQATEPLKQAMKEATTMAKNALNMMTEHASDQHVKEMLKLVLGEGQIISQSLMRSRANTLENVLVYDNEISPDRPLDQTWQNTMTNDDLMIFCSLDRYKQLKAPNNEIYFDTSMKNRPDPPTRFESGGVRDQCHSKEYDVNSLDGRTMAFTTPSHRYNMAAYTAAPKPKHMGDFMVERLDSAFAIDFCTWYLHKQLILGWPSITHERIAQTQQPEFKGVTEGLSTPIDGLRNAGLSMLHELTHTRPGGELNDVTNLPPGTPMCYGWKCVQDLKDPSNSDNVAMLGLALHLWTMGYYVDQDGNVKGRM